LSPVKASGAGAPFVHARGEDGVALLTVLLMTTLALALGGGLMVVAVTEARIAGHYRDGLQAMYAADALIERLVAELHDAEDVSAVLSAPLTSTFNDGAAGDLRIVHETTINLTELTEVQRCGRASGCSDAAIRAPTAERPWGANNPRWRLYAWGWMRHAIGAAEAPAVYLVAWVGDDPAERDGDPLLDGSGEGRGRVAVRVRAFGAHGTQRELEAIIAGVPDRPHLIHWTER
jgi:hypothetical protein